MIYDTMVDKQGSGSEAQVRRLSQKPTAFAPAIEPLDTTSFKGSCTRIRATTLMVVDVTAGLIAFLFTYELANFMRLDGFGITESVERIPNLFNVFLVGVIPISMIVGLSALWAHYNRRLTYWSELRDTMKAAIYAAAVLSFIMFAFKINFSRLWVIAFFLVLIMLMPVGRYLSRKMLQAVGVWEKPVVVIGDGAVAFKHAKKVCGDSYMGPHIVSYVEITSRDKLGKLTVRLRHGADVSEDTFGANRECPHVVVAVENPENLKRSKKALYLVMGSCAAVASIPLISAISLYNSQLIQAFRGDVVVLSLHDNLRRKSAKVLKRTIDVVLCAMALLALSPIMLVISFLVRLDGGPAFYGQERIGEGGRKFKCLKIRSMGPNADENLRKLLESDAEARESWEKDHKLKNDPRITKIGNLLRKTSLDELPQFWNVLRGEMSLIGPRPIVDDEIVRYGNDFSYYAEAKPGITGLWQISGRNDTSYRERVALDVWYVKNWSPWLDIVIALKTIPILVVGVGAY